LRAKRLERRLKIAVAQRQEQLLQWRLGDHLFAQPRTA
jgi:hypothetical protein